MPRRFVDSVRRLLIIAASVPQAGRMKTRLVSEKNGISEGDAARFTMAFLRDTVEKAVAAAPLVPADVWLALDGDESQLPDDLRGGAGVRAISQGGGERGERLTRLFEQGFAEKYEQILLIGGDTPHLPPAFLVDAWGRLKTGQTDLVLGPTENGGYYLVGLEAAPPGLFNGITESAGTALGGLRERAETRSLRIAQTPPWYDVATEGDLRRLHFDLLRGVVHAPQTRAALAALYN